MSKLTTELVEEILSRVPMTSMRSVRCTCRNWNTICKDATFTKKHLSQTTTSKGEILTVVMMNCSLHLMRVNLQRGGLDHPMRRLRWRFNTGGSFVVDEENAAVVVFDEGKNVEKPTRNAAYIVGFGESSYFREVDLGKITTGKEGFPHACSYVPSSVQTS
uniref:F-box domain-containing protein n=1 Tax=Brassica campestris TaxID=3711 RepID=M4EEK1_BRACM